MRHDRRLSFDRLESRKLLAQAHPASAHLVHAEVVTPVALDGTLTVNNKEAAANEDVYNDITISTPVSGVLAGVGAVKGTWDTSYDSNGDYMGPDSLQLHNTQGTFVVTFTTSNHGKTHKTATGASFPAITQHLRSGTKAYAHVAESGSVVVNTNASGKTVESMTLTTTSV